jgi:hypothetical protein
MFSTILFSPCKNFYNNNNVIIVYNIIINNDDATLQDPILLLRIPMGTGIISPKIIDNLGTRCAKGSSALV